jgi:spore coat protein A
MDSTDRREFLKLLAQTFPALALVGTADCASAQRARDVVSASHTPAKLDRYIDPLPIPKRIAPFATHKDKDIYRIRMMEFKGQLHSQLPPSTLWGYEAQYPGPVIEAFRDRPIEVHWENHLPMRHVFTVDPHIHGAMPPTPAVRTVPHLHGARTRSASDGLPEKWFTPGTSAQYSYPNTQQAATLWYHDHAIGITRLNVYAGLSGFYLLRDEEERAMNLPAGAYEIPLLIQDRMVDESGQLVYSPTHEDGVKLPPGVWGPEFFGNLPVVNGAVYPFCEVEPRPYRFRVLNGANSRFFNLFFNLANHVTDIPALIPIHQIGTDGGFLTKPAAVNKLLLGPAERADIIIDFSGHEGKTVTLCNDAAAPFPGWSMSMVHHDRLNELMQFRVNRPLVALKSAFVMPTASSFSRIDGSSSSATRDFVLSEQLDDQGHSLGVRINSKGYDDPVTEVVKLGTTETWRFINTTDDAHPMHLHLVQFQIVQRQQFNAIALAKGRLQMVGMSRPPAPNESGWKDTAIVNPQDVLTILVRFDGYAGRYVFHCHMLEHEDNDMMRPFEVVAVEQK